MQFPVTPVAVSEAMDNYNGDELGVARERAATPVVKSMSVAPAA